MSQHAHSYFFLAVTEQYGKGLTLWRPSYRLSRAETQAQFKAKGNRWESFSQQSTGGNCDTQVSLHRAGLPLMPVGIRHVTHLQGPASKLVKSSSKCPRKPGASPQVISQWELGIWLLAQYNEILLCLYCRSLYLHNWIQFPDTSFIISIIFRAFICVIFVLQKERK